MLTISLQNSERWFKQLSNTPDQVAMFKQIMGSYPTGVTVVTALNKEGKPMGMTVNSFASVSLSPLLILWCIDRKVSMFDDFQSTDKFAVHVLSKDQADACWTFAGKEADRFSKVTWNQSEHQLPIISDSLGVLECKKVNQIDAGDHVIYIGEVIGLSANENDPLLYYRRNVGAIPEGWPNQ